jgi:hypothetical protein
MARKLPKSRKSIDIDDVKKFSDAALEVKPPVFVSDENIEDEKDVFDSEAPALRKLTFMFNDYEVSEIDRIAEEENRSRGWIVRKTLRVHLLGLKAQRDKRRK